jgi:uncharacterized membrane protein YfhO
MLTTGGWFRSIELQAGEHAVRFDFAPTGLIAGLVITLLTLGAFIGVRRWAA